MNLTWTVIVSVLIELLKGKIPNWVLALFSSTFKSAAFVPDFDSGKMKGAPEDFKAWVIAQLKNILARTNIRIPFVKDILNRVIDRVVDNLIDAVYDRLFGKGEQTEVLIRNVPPVDFDDVIGKEIGHEFVEVENIKTSTDAEPQESPAAAEGDEETKPAKSTTGRKPRQ